MITVWTICWGTKYPHEYVRSLKRQVARHLREPHEFVCVTAADIDRIGTIDPWEAWPGWWQKVQLFRPGRTAPRNLWLDLDVVITGPLDALCEPLPVGVNLRAPLNWAQSGHGGVQSSMMFWEGDSAAEIYERFDPSRAHWPPRNEPGFLWGDQEWITELRDREVLNVQPTRPEHVRSYKYHCRHREQPPEDMRVCVFHGKPDPHEVPDGWVRCARL